MDRCDAWSSRHWVRVHKNSNLKYFLQYLRPEHFFWSAVMNCLSVLHQQDMICELRREIDIVCNDEGRHTLLIAAISNHA